METEVPTDPDGSLRDGAVGNRRPYSVYPLRRVPRLIWFSKDGCRVLLVRPLPLRGPSLPGASPHESWDPVTRQLVVEGRYRPESLRGPGGASERHTYRDRERVVVRHHPHTPPTPCVASILLYSCTWVVVP